MSINRSFDRQGQRAVRSNLTRTTLGLAIAAALCSTASAQQGAEEITVTGTRILQSGMDTPVPVTAVQADELAKMSPGTLIESLSQLPQFYGNIEPQQIVGGQNSGGASLDLRGAGVNRTLVLLDGRRIVASNRFGAVDVSVIPEELVRSVETVTGGASASYGTDAVAGVVNFVLDKDFEGIKGHGQGGVTSRGDGKNYEVSIALGKAFDNGLHVLLSGSVFRQAGINSFESLQDRDWFTQAARITNNLGGPSQVLADYVSPTNNTYGGIINQTGSALDKLEFLSDGSVQPLGFSGLGQLNGGCNCRAEDFQSYGVDRDDEVAPSFRRGNAFAYLDMDVTDNVTLFAQGLYGTSRNSDRRESIHWLGPWQNRLYADNPFIPAYVRDTMVAENRQFVGFGFYGLNNPDTPLGDSRQIADNEMYSLTFGFDANFNGGLLDGWQMNGYYQYGRNKQDFIAENGIRVDRVFIAFDSVADPVTGQPVCRAALADPVNFGDCVPLNLFGGVQNISPQAAAYIVDDGKLARQKTSQHFAEIVLSGELFEGFGAGSINAAFGGSYREDKLDQRTVDPSDEFPALVNGTLLETLGNIQPPGVRGIFPEGDPTLPAGYTGIPGLRYVPNGFKGDANSSSVTFSSLRAIAGGFNVKELFGEVNVPLVRDASFADNIDLIASLRWADYSGSGAIWAWKAGLNWQVNDSLRLRVTESRDVRAATLRERFDQTRGGTNVTDPENNNALISTASFSGGNENVNPEKADTITAGFVYQPEFLSGFSLSADWYWINIKDAIGQLSSQNVVSGCFAGDQTLCQYVLRDSISNQIVRVDNLFINLSNQRISGVDVEMTYNTDIDFLGGEAESLTWRFFGSWIDQNSIKNPGSARDDRVGQLSGGFSLPELKLTSNITYSNGPFSVFVQGRWIDGGIMDRFMVEGVTVDDNSVSSIFYTDLRLSYTMGEEHELEFFANVNNVFDQDPRSTPAPIGRTGTNQFNTSLYDTVGRRFVVGMNFKY
ncbi:MAG: TonB-dependent receptor [Gammaproteobacteria bacterium]|nr:TonB-dependent receptor [Gammaproteobacteria bacterium]